MMKIIGTAIVTLSVFLISLTFYKKYKCRPEQLGFFINIISIYYAELKWSQKSIYEIIGKLDDKRYEQYIFTVRRLMQHSNSVDSFVLKNDRYATMSLNADDTLILKHFFEECGKSNLSGELQLCEKTLCALSERKNEADAEYKKMGPLSVKLGIAFSAWIAILLT